MIGLLTDSSSQLPAPLRDRFAVEVVPITVTVGEQEYREGVDLTADDFYARLTDPLPAIKTAQPSPGEFAEGYRRLVERGASSIVAVLVGRAFSGAVNSATVAAGLVDVEVHVVDSGTASFGISACLWELADALRRGVELADALELTRSLVPRIGISMLLQGLDFVVAGGRVAADRLLDEPAVVYAGVGDALDVVGSARSAAEIDELLFRPFAEAPGPIRAAVALADPSTLAFCEHLEARLRRADHVEDVTRYRVGPSVAAHTGPGTAGGVFWPAMSAPSRG